MCPTSRFSVRNQFGRNLQDPLLRAGEMFVRTYSGARWPARNHKPEAVSRVSRTILPANKYSTRVKRCPVYVCQWAILARCPREQRERAHRIDPRPTMAHEMTIGVGFGQTDVLIPYRHSALRDRTVAGDTL